MTTAIVDTTVLTDALLKDDEAARRALAGATILHYAVKEFRHGPFGNFVYAHNLLVEERTLPAARARLRSIGRQLYKQRTTQEALDLAEAGLLRGDRAALFETLDEAARACGGEPAVDELFASVYRDDLARRLREALRWLEGQRSRVTHHLTCYEHGGLKSCRDGTLDDGVRRCPRSCALGVLLAEAQDDVSKLAVVVEAQEGKPENVKRLDALRWVSQNVGAAPSADHCRALGDAVFALLCPSGGTIVTTNLKDHEPLASALGKSVRRPE